MSPRQSTGSDSDDSRREAATAHDRAHHLEEVVHDLEVHQEELRQQHSELVDSRRALEEARDRYEHLFDCAPIGYVVVDGHGVIREANLSAAELFGIARPRLLGRTLWRHVHPMDRQRAQQHLLRCRRRESRVETELCLERAPDDLVPVQLTSTPAASARFGGDLFHTVIVDLTERKRAEAERARALEEQQRLLQEEQVTRAASAAKDRFIAMLSHELRTPLAPILFAVDTAKSRGSIPEALNATLDMIRRNVLLETRLIDDLLDMTRIVQGKMSVITEIIDLRDVVSDVVALCQEQIDRAPATVATDLGAAVHSVRADPVRLRQVVWNLLNNALRNTFEGGSILLRTANEAPGWLTLTVCDTGRGIEPTMLSRLFTFFEQDDESRRRGVGLGLGLAISKAIVESHGGRIRADSAGPGTGATFTVELRTAADEAPRTAIPRPIGVPREAAPILLVEDDVDSAEAIAEFLRLHGYTVKVAISMRQALDLFAPGDVVVSDIGLPDGSGHQLMREITRAGAVPAIALSGYGTPDDIRRSAEAGFAHHIVKPVNPNELLAAIGDLGSG